MKIRERQRLQELLAQYCPAEHNCLFCTQPVTLRQGDDGCGWIECKACGSMIFLNAPEALEGLERLSSTYLLPTPDIYNVPQRPEDLQFPICYGNPLAPGDSQIPASYDIPPYPENLPHTGHI